MFPVMFIVSAVLFVFGYKFYGDFMAKVYDLDNKNPTPAEQLNDGVDYCPAHPAVVLGHHFSSIAGAGPIVGPITAASIFGWLPTIMWCVLGSIFLGGPHDMGSLVSSMRHEGKSVGVVIERWIGETGKKLFLGFTILSLILVVAVFLVLTTATFVTDPVVAFVGCLYILLAVISGILIYRFNLNFKIVTVFMLIIVAICSFKGGDWPFVAAMFTHSADQWNMFLAIYILAASVLPVWLLLQPRDYLASFFLYFAVGIGAIGMLFGAKMDSGAIPVLADNVKYFGLTKLHLWPMLFVIVACGAISGFHSLVGRTGWNFCGRLWTVLHYSRHRSRPWNKAWSHSHQRFPPHIARHGNKARALSDTGIHGRQDRQIPCHNYSYRSCAGARLCEDDRCFRQGRSCVGNDMAGIRSFQSACRSSCPPWHRSMDNPRPQEKGDIPNRPLLVYACDKHGRTGNRDQNNTEQSKPELSPCRDICDTSGTCGPDGQRGT